MFHFCFRSGSKISLLWVILVSTPTLARPSDDHSKLVPPNLSTDMTPVPPRTRALVPESEQCTQVASASSTSPVPPGTVDRAEHMKNTALCAGYAMLWAAVGKHLGLSSLSRSRIPAHVEKALDALGISVSQLIAFITAEGFKTACTESLTNVVRVFDELGTAMRAEKVSSDRLREACQFPEEYSKCYVNSGVSKGANAKLAEEYLLQTTLVMREIAETYGSPSDRKAVGIRAKELQKRLNLLSTEKNAGIRDLIFADVHNIAQAYCFASLCTEGHPQPAQHYANPQTVKGLMIDVEAKGSGRRSRYFRVYPENRLSLGESSTWRGIHGLEMRVGRFGRQSRTWYLPASTPEAWTERWVSALDTIYRIQQCR